MFRFFGHLARSAPEEDHHRVNAAALRPPTDWRRPVGRPRATWLRTIDEDVQLLNFGVHTAWRKARDRDTWQQVVSTATLCYRSSPPRRRSAEFSDLVAACEISLAKACVLELVL